MFIPQRQVFVRQIRGSWPRTVNCLSVAILQTSMVYRTIIVSEESTPSEVENVRQSGTALRLLPLHHHTCNKYRNSWITRAISLWLECRVTSPGRKRTCFLMDLGPCCCLMFWLTSMNSNWIQSSSGRRISLLFVYILTLAANPCRHLKMCPWCFQLF